MKNQSNVKVFLTLLAMFGVSIAFGAWPFSEMSKWKKAMRAELEEGKYGNLQIRLKNLRNQTNPTKQDKQKILFLELLTEEE